MGRREEAWRGGAQKALASHASYRLLRPAAMRCPVGVCARPPAGLCGVYGNNSRFCGSSTLHQRNSIHSGDLSSPGWSSVRGSKRSLVGDVQSQENVFPAPRRMSAFRRSPAKFRLSIRIPNVLETVLELDIYLSSVPFSTFFHSCSLFWHDGIFTSK